MANSRHLLGRQAEAAVATWLESLGWCVLARRWRVAEGELDLVCRDPGAILVGVEVRARSSQRVGSALESVDARHLARMRAALGRYASGDHSHRGLRLDLVTVTPLDDRWRLARLAGIDAW